MGASAMMMRCWWCGDAVVRGTRAPRHRPAPPLLLYPLHHHPDPHPHHPFPPPPPPNPPSMLVPQDTNRALCQWRLLGWAGWARAAGRTRASLCRKAATHSRASPRRVPLPAPVPPLPAPQPPCALSYSHFACCQREVPPRAVQTAPQAPPRGKTVFRPTPPVAWARFQPPGTPRPTTDTPSPVPGPPRSTHQ